MKFLTLAFLSLALFAEAADMTDFDGDGLPDVWEAAFGFRTNSAVGVDGPYGDQDGDGLNNFAEYRAGYYEIGANIYSNFDWAVPGLNPTNAFSADSLWSDYDFVPRNSLVTLGWLFSDNDFVLNSWEETNSFCSVRTSDNSTTRGNETAFSMAMKSVTGSKGTVFLDVSYHGIYRQNQASVIVSFYSRPTMDGLPDAIASFSAPSSLDSGTRVALTNIIQGSVGSGTRYMSAFLDLNGNASRDATEPFGVATPYAVDLGYDGGLVAIEMTDFVPGYLRIPLGTTITAQSTHVRVIRMKVDDSFSYQEKVFDANILVRTYLHEGDLLANGQLALDWGLIGVPPAMNPTRFAYNVIVGDDQVLTNNVVASFTNTFSASRAQAVSTYPVNGTHVYSSRPTFKWTMPQEYNAFTIEIKRGSPAGLTVYNSGAQQVPPRDANGNCVWTAPIYANTRLPSGEVFAANTVYAWRVIAMNAKFSDTASNWSEWKLFRLSSSASMQTEEYGTIDIVVKYFGTASSLLGQRVKVQAYRNKSFSGKPDGEYTLAGANLSLLTDRGNKSVNATIGGLSKGFVYVRAFLDHNLNGTLDPWESWGFVMDRTTFLPTAVQVVDTRTFAGTNIVVITDTDSDNDRFPDAWEFEKNSGSANFLELTGPSTLTGIDAEINPELKLAP
ncbi:MAG: hypothetical protein BWY57_02028 [Betaproteobacteria bacterium ADurb.Bin341]|nr:MAG: hypothetical protein BWY57_02028 [Betaproteobacteria bacterium ADurb.Bin341]